MGTCKPDLCPLKSPPTKSPHFPKGRFAMVKKPLNKRNRKRIPCDALAGF